MIYYLLFFVVLLIIIIRNRIREGFNFIYKSGDDPYKMSYTSFGCVDKINFDITFLTKQDGCIELNREIPYFKTMNTMDRKIKGNTIQNCKLIQDWTESDKKAIKIMLLYAQLKTKCNFGFQRKIMSTPWKFVKVDSTVENGFPHTHNDIIFLPANFIKKIVNDLETQTKKEVYDNIGHIIIHEKVHVWQRVEPELFYNLYKMLNIDRLRFSEQTRKWLRENTRTNPDGLELEWGYRDEYGKYYVFVSLWNKDATSLSDIKNVAIPLVPNKIHSLWNITDYSIKNIIPINRISSWKDIVGLTHNHYHPNEISAEGIARYTIEDKNTLPIDIKIEEWLLSMSIV
jgi:hypothetical protein